MSASCDRLLSDVNRLNALPDSQFASEYLSFLEAAERCFSKEELDLDVAEYPFLKSHRQQHAVLLSSLHHLTTSVMNGDVGLARELFRCLPVWLIFHAVSDQYAASLKPEQKKRYANYQFDGAKQPQHSSAILQK